jgi:hypothetical protein
MLNYNKKSDLKRLFDNIIDTNSLVESVFLDNPDLQSFSFSCISEYDDNNYSDQNNLISVNGHGVDYEGRYEDEDGYEGIELNEKSNLPRVNSHAVMAIMDVVADIGNYYGYGEDHEITRDSVHNTNRKDRIGMKYLKSYFSGAEIEEEWFTKHDPKWAAYYAQEHGRFSKEAEVKIFCNPNCMREAFMYAQALNRKLPVHIENFFVTHHVVGTIGKSDDIWLKEYLKFKQHIENKKLNKATSK